MEKSQQKSEMLSNSNHLFRIIMCFVFSLSLTSCRLNQPMFNDAAWQRDINGTDPALLYAPHYGNGKYFNPWMPATHGSPGRFLRWKLSSRQDYTEEEKKAMPGFKTGLKARIDDLLPEDDFIAWIGHMTYLIRANGELWLFDPMFSDRALIPKRVTPPALSLDEMNAFPEKLNIVISHNHYDHLDEASLKALNHDARVFVPLGLKGTVADTGKHHVTEMDWWQKIDCGNGTTLVCLPAQHWSRRVFQASNTTLWASFMLITRNTTIYFGGDSGYFIGYREFSKQYPEIDYAIISTGAYHPRWFMHYAHMNADESLQAFLDLGAGFFIPGHWGAFQLGDEPVGYPLLDLRRTMTATGFDTSKALIMDIGELIRIPGKKAITLLRELSG